MTTIAIVTPWLEHRELARDYFACVAGLRVNDHLIIVDNGSSPLLEFATIRL